MRNVTNQPQQRNEITVAQTVELDELSLALEHNQSSVQERQRMMDQLHALAIVDFDQVRTDDQSYNLTREGKDSCDALSTGTLGRLIDPARGFNLPNGWVVAVIKDELHSRAAGEFQAVWLANTSYQMTRTGDPDTAVDIIPTETLNQWLRKDNVLPVIPWVRAICLDELHGRAVVQMADDMVVRERRTQFLDGVTYGNVALVGIVVDLANTALLDYFSVTRGEILDILHAQAELQLAAQSDWSACDCHGRMYRTEDLTDRDGVLQCHQADDNNPLPVAWRQAVMR